MKTTQQYLNDPNFALAQELMRTGQSTAPVPNATSGIARMLTGLVGAYNAKNLMNKYQTQSKQTNEAITQALANKNVSTGVKPWINPDTGEEAIAGIAPGMDTVIANIQSNPNYSTNPNIQEYAQALGMSNLQNKANMQNDLMKQQLMSENRLREQRALYTDPQILGGKMRIAQAGRDIVNVGAQEKEEDKAVGKAFGEQYVEMQKAGVSANNKINRLDRVDSLLKNIDTGRGKSTTTEIKAYAKSLGIDLERVGIKDDIAPVEAANALLNEMTLEARNPSGGAGMPGAMSDADREFLSKIQPGINATAEGRKKTIETMRKLAIRDKEVAKLARDYRKANGRLDEGFYDTLSQYSDNNPLFVVKENTSQMPAQIPVNSKGRPSLDELFRK